MAASAATDTAGNTSNSLPTFTSDNLSLILPGKVGAVRYSYPTYQKCVLVDNNSGSATSIVYNSDSVKYEDFITNPPPSNVTSTTSQTNPADLIANHDAQIRLSGHSSHSSYPNTNFGDVSYNQIMNWTASGSLVEYKILIRFDLSGYAGPVTGATLTLHSAADPFFTPYDTWKNSLHGAGVGISSATRPWTIYRATSGWDESTVTWNTAPTYTSTNSIIGDAAPASASQDMVVDVTDQINDMIAAGNDYGFFIEHDTSTTYSNYTFSTKENAVTCGLPPTLSIAP